MTHDPDQLYDQGNACARDGDLHGAIAFYDKAIAINPNKPQYHNNKGSALKNLGDLPGAIDSYRRAITVDPGYAKGYLSLANLQGLVGQNADAIATYGKFIALARSGSAVLNPIVGGVTIADLLNPTAARMLRDAKELAVSMFAVSLQGKPAGEQEQLTECFVAALTAAGPTAGEVSGPIADFSDLDRRRERFVRMIAEFQHNLFEGDPNRQTITTEQFAKLVVHHDSYLDAKTAGDLATARFHVEAMEKVFQTGGCFIATAAYGSASAPQVQALRDYRDDVLLRHQTGRRFVTLYYTVSPPVARYVAKRPWARALVRWVFLNSLVAWVSNRASRRYAG